MSEQEPEMTIILNGHEFKLLPSNSSLWLHVGAAAVFDHIFLRTQEEPPAHTYIPSNAGLFPQLKEFMLDNDYPLHANLLDAAEQDREVLTRFWMRDLVQIEDVTQLTDEWDKPMED